jgi:hypothetical protein
MTTASSNECILFGTGTNRRILDGGVINKSFYKALLEGKLKLPPANGNKHLPYAFNNDKAFALQKYFFKLYREKEFNHDCTFQ